MTKTGLFKTLTTVALLTIAGSLIGCTHYYVPKEHPMSSEALPEFRGAGDVSLKNGHDSPKEILIGVQGAHKWMGDMQKWTETAVGLTRSELEKRNYKVVQGAPKELRLTVTRANIYWGFAAIRCILYLKVESSDGYINEYEGNNASGWTLYRACDGAVTRAVAAMLKDERVLAYLNR